MSRSTPAIFSPRIRPAPLSGQARVGLGLLAAGCLVLLFTAASILPSPTGVGTHEGLGLHGCQFLENTGLPCPSCGMTTSWAWFVRGNLAASAYIQPMGFLLALAAAMTIWAAGYSALSGRNLAPLLRRLPGKSLLLCLLGFAVAAWAWKIYIHLHGLDGWT
jgi:hypothetical protein